MQKDTRKKVSFVLFVMAVFLAGVVLTEFHSIWWMVALAGAALFITACFMVTSKEEEKQAPTEKTSEILMIDRLAEFFRNNEKAEKGVYIAVKKQHEDMNRSVEGLLERLDALLSSQENAVKTIVKYNRENARQMALSERDELERLGERMEDMLRLLQEDCEFMRNSHETELSELEHIVNATEEMKYSLKTLSDNKVDASAFVNELPRVPLEALIPADLMEEDVERLLEEEPEEEPVAEPEEAFEPVAEPEEALLSETLSPEELLPAGFFEEKPEEEMPLTTEPEGMEEPIDMFASAGVDLSDPDRPLSPEDIAALVAAANGRATSVPEEEAVPEMVLTEEPTLEELLPTEPEEIKEPEDAFASSGVDLSDPNRTLSPDDIAALIASLGN